MSTPKKGFDPLASLFDLPETPPPPAPKVDVAPAVTGGDVPSAAQLKPVVPAGPDPVQLAKILAKAAASKAAAAAPGGASAAQASSAPASVAEKPLVAKVSPPQAARPAPAKPAPPAAKPKVASSLASRLAPPPKRALSAEEALNAARSDEEAQRHAQADKRADDQQKAAAAKAIFQARVAAAAAPVPVGKPTPAAMREDQLTDMIAGIVTSASPELGAVYVANAILMDERVVLAGLWRAHRAKFAAAGDLAGAVACGAVLRALTTVPIGQLVAAHAVTDKSDWLVWVDMVAGSPLAAFRDARVWFAQG